MNLNVQQAVFGSEPVAFHMLICFGDDIEMETKYKKEGERGRGGVGWGLQPPRIKCSASHKNFSAKCSIRNGIRRE
jgi:hypothetical protein